MGQAIPLPRGLSANNPYWYKRAIAGIRPEFQPRLSFLDFVHAMVWEMYGSWDINAATFVRQAMINTVKMNFELSRKLNNREKKND